ncbi:Peptidase S8 [Macleaya cordata]|uniref:Peptidase S8 n=1 Tax=Macleaya cordata TaxID=56857 RepID=A0A200QMW3_MACCD|nr:Peptidase S8 [Macleaya cordata]
MNISLADYKSTCSVDHGSIKRAHLANGEPQKVANLFDFGGGLVNPNREADPGPIYDIGTPDYTHYLCSMGYNDSSISELTQNPTVCPSK